MFILRKSWWEFLVCNQKKPPHPVGVGKGVCLLIDRWGSYYSFVVFFPMLIICGLDSRDQIEKTRLCNWQDYSMVRSQMVKFTR